MIYVTGNRGKYLNVKEHFKKYGLDIEHADLDIEELEVDDVSKVSLDKALKAYEKLGKPLFVADSGFYIEDYPNRPGYPGAFAKRSGISNNVENLLEVMKDTSNRNCKFVDCLTYYDGKMVRQFYGISEGFLSYEIRGGNSEKSLSNLWKVFIPKNESKTLAEMSDYERTHRNDGHTSATEEFIRFLLSPDILMEDNFRNLERRVIDSLDRTDLEHIRNVLANIKEPTLVTGSGGSSVVSLFTSKILEAKNGIISSSISPRDVLYRKQLYPNIMCCSYSGSNYGVDMSFNNDKKHYLLSTISRDNVTCLPYVMEGETSFISLAATLTPMAIMLSYYLNGDTSVIKEILGRKLDMEVSTASTYEVMSGYESSVAAKYLESTMIEAGLGNCVVHDKYDYCHGRSTVGYKKDNQTIYFDGHKDLDKLLIELLNERRVMRLPFLYDDPIVNEFYLTYMSMLLTHEIAYKSGKGLSKVNYDSSIVKKVYRYQGNM